MPSSYALYIKLQSRLSFSVIFKTVIGSDVHFTGIDFVRRKKFQDFCATEYLFENQVDFPKTIVQYKVKIRNLNFKGREHSLSFICLK